MNRPRRFAIGDPQASLDRLHAVLRASGLMRGAWLDDDVRLIAIGDYFDYGRREEHAQVRKTGHAVLQWLSEHDPEQVVLIAGNHDLVRVGELAGFSDEQFLHANALACAAYPEGNDGPVIEELEQALLDQYPALPTAQVACRDFAAFSVQQRTLVDRLLVSGRLKLAHAEDGMLFTHAGITVPYLLELGLEPTASAQAIAAELNRRLLEAARSRGDAPLFIKGIHRPGQRGEEGAGMLFHRPANPQAPANKGHELNTTMSRRYDARSIPPGLTQVVGHISDGKCKKLLGDWWKQPGEAKEGVLRHMHVGDGEAHYRHGLPVESGENAMMIFIDGGMSRVAPEAYELFEL